MTDVLKVDQNMNIDLMGKDSLLTALGSLYQRWNMGMDK